MKWTGVGGVEYCQFETFDARCSDSEVVLVTYASYGRLRLGRCATTDYGSIGCSADVTELLDSVCSGHSHCSVDVVSLRTIVQPCSTDLTSYLDVSFYCAPGTTSVTHLSRLERCTSSRTAYSFTFTAVFYVCYAASGITQFMALLVDCCKKKTML